MRKIVPFMLWVLLVSVFAPAAAANHVEPGNNITCRLDGEAASGQAVATATCLQLDPQTHGEFDLRLSLTLQVLDGSDWVDVETVECTGSSTNGIGATGCATSPDAPPEGTYRGLIDLDEPKDWRPAVAQPHYQGGEPLDDVLASDACDVNELVDSDLTAPDAPWADLCAVTMEHVIVKDDESDGGDDELESVTVIVHVAGFVDARTPTTSWTVHLSAGECRHEVAVHDDGYVGEAGVRITSNCEAGEPVPCGFVGELLAELLGGTCSAGQTWEESETVALAAETVEYDADQLRITFSPRDLGPLASTNLVAGATVRSVSAFTTTGLGSAEDGSRLAFDGDFASSTRRTYTFD